MMHLCVGLSNKIHIKYVDVCGCNMKKGGKVQGIWISTTVYHYTQYCTIPISGLSLLSLVLYLGCFFLNFSHIHNISLLLMCQSVSLNISLFSPLSSLSPPFSYPVSGCCCLITQTLKLKTSTGETVYNHHRLNIPRVMHCICLYLVLCARLRRDGGCASWSEVTTWFPHFATD